MYGVVLALFALVSVWPLPVLSQDEGTLGFLEPYRQVELGFSEAGRVGAIHVKEGQAVSAGETLAELDNRVLEASIEIARARSESEVGISMARMNLRDRTTRYEQLAKLRHSGNAREDEVARAVLARDLAEGELRAAMEQQEISLLEYRRRLAEREQRRIVSPLNGVVIGVDKQVGEIVNAADAPAISVVQLNILKLVLHIDEVKTRDLQRTSRVSVFVTGADEPVTGVVDYLSPVVDPRSQTVEVNLVINNSKGTYRSGQRAWVKLD